MSEPRWAVVCKQEQSVPLDPSVLCCAAGVAAGNPVDNFYSDVARLVPLGKKEDLQGNETLGKILLLGLVSATEHYFRAVLAGLVHICPLARKQAAALQVSFGAFEYYPKHELGLALFEQASLATAGEIRKHTQRIVGIEIKQDPSTEAALTEYDKLCQLRHAAVHSRGNLGHQNLQELGIAPSLRRLAVKVELPGFHLAAAVCQNVVRAYNRLLYRKTLERWMAHKRLNTMWSDDRVPFSQLFALFHSHHDSEGPRSAYHAYRSFLPTLRKAVTSTNK